MDQDILVRLFRSINIVSDENLFKVAKKIIELEKEKGHRKLAEKLNEILVNNAAHRLEKIENTNISLVQKTILPLDRRHGSQLATLIGPEHLRYEMVLNEFVENHLKRIEREYIARERLAHFGLKPRRKILLYGAPGCGKSMAAERIAKNVGLPFLKVRFEAITSSYLGESASNLRQLFEYVQSNPCVLLLDEFDFIAKARTSGQDVGEMHRIVNILLGLLEDYDAQGFLIATTNLEGSLDKALFRRFDDIVEIPKPGINEIARLLAQTLSSISLGKDVKLFDFSKKLEGFTAALVVKIANDAAKEAVLQGAKYVDKLHLTKSLEENVNYNK